MVQVLTEKLGIGSPDFSIPAWKKVHKIRSNKDTDFVQSLAQNETAELNLPGLVSNKIRITGIRIISKQALKYRVCFYSRDTFTDSDLGEDSFVGAVEVDIPTYGSYMTFSSA
jgi:hypothetical protein